MKVTLCIIFGVKDYSKVEVVGQSSDSTKTNTPQANTEDQKPTKSNNDKKNIAKELLLKKKYPAFYYKNLYDPKRSGLPDQMMTASNNVNSVNTKYHLTNKLNPSHNGNYSTAQFNTNKLSNSKLIQGPLGSYGNLNHVQNNGRSSSLQNLMPTSAFSSGAGSSLFNIQRSTNQVCS